jgi:hypothetical protein
LYSRPLQPVYPDLSWLALNHVSETFHFEAMALHHGTSDESNAGYPAMTPVKVTSQRRLYAAIVVSACVLVALLAIDLTIAVAHAQSDENTAANTAAARALAIEGVELARAGRCDAAIDKLERAETLHHSPIVLGQLGECYVVQHRLVEGTELLRKVLRDPLPTSPSPALRKAYTRAQYTLDAAKPKIAMLTISVHGTGETEPVVVIDARPLPSVLLGAGRPIDPGEHAIEVSAPGFLAKALHVTVAAGEKREMVLELEPEPAAEAVASAPEVAGSSRASIDHGTMQRAVAQRQSLKSPDRTAAYASWLVGAVGIGVGTLFGVMAMNGKRDLDKRCQGNVCSADTAAALAAARQKGTISTIGFSVGAAGAAIGTILFFTVGLGAGASDAADTAIERSPRARRDTAGPSIRSRAEIGVGGARFVLDF